MGIEFWATVGFTLSVGAGALLLVRAFPSLSQRAKALDMWPDRKDEPGPIPGWVIWPEWSYALFADLLRRSAQRGVRWGAVLIVIGFAGVALLAKLSQN